MRQIRHIFEALMAILMLLIFRLIGFRAASYLAGIITRLIGKRHKAHRIAYGNMLRAMPEIGEIERVKMLDKMWMSLGRIIGEYVYICRISKKNLAKRVLVTKETVENVKRMRERSNDKKSPKGGIIFSGHIGNWDVGLRYLMLEGVKVNAFYRPLSNGYVDKIMSTFRQYKPIAKGRNGLKDIISAIKRGEYVIIMADQKVTDGEPVKFFHEDAKTTTSIARIALKYDVEIVSARGYRTDDGLGFKFEAGRPLEIERSGNLNKDVLKITKTINETLEEWIRQVPSQWFWVHNRWK